MAMELDANALPNVGAAHADDQSALQVAEANTTPPATGTPPTTTIQLEAGDIVHLPAGADISHPVQVGADLEFVQPDGSILLIPNGAVADLTVFVGNVEIPADTIAALFSDNNIQPAEGPGGNNQHAHGNFTHEPGGIGSSFGLTGLLGPTDLSFAPNSLPNLEGNLAPTFDGNLLALVSEEALPEGHEDSGDPDDPFDSKSFSHSLGVHDTDPLTFTIDPPSNLTSGGEPLDWATTVTPNSFTLTGTIDGGTETIISIVIDFTARDYTVTLSGPIDHPDAGEHDEDIFNAVFKITATDTHGATGQTNLTVEIEDDSPALASGNGQVRVVDEDDIDTHLSQGNHADDGPWPDGSFTGNPFIENGDNPHYLEGPAVVFGNLGTVVDFGADGPRTDARGGAFELLNTTSANDYLTGLGLSSKGDALAYAIDDTTGTITATAGGRTVFVFELESDGHYSFKLYDQLDHDAPYDDFPHDGPGYPGDHFPLADQNLDLQDAFPNADVTSIDFGQLIRAFDNDNDYIDLDGHVKIAVRDDIPELVRHEHEIKTVNEDDIDTWLSQGTSPNDGDQDGSFTGSPFGNGHGPADVFGNLQHLVRVGADETDNGGAAFSFINEHLARLYLSSLGLSSKGHELSYDIKNGVLYAFDNAGPFPGEHYNPSVDRLVFTLDLSENGNYSFKLYDQLDHDRPYDDFGDQPHIPGDTATADQNLDLQDGVPFRDVTGIDFGKIIDATDADGDSVNLGDAFKIQIRDDIPIATGATFTGTADEDDLQDYNLLYPLVDFWQGSIGTSPNDGTPPDDSTTGLLGTVPVWGNLSNLVQVGADEGGKFQIVSEHDAETWLQSINLKSQGDAIDDARDITIPGIGEAMGFFASDGRLVFGVYVGEDGVFNFRLFDQLDHPGHDDPSTPNVTETSFQDTLALDFSKLITFSDFDHDKVVFDNGTITINVVDDVPVLVDSISATLDEDDLNDFNPINAALLALSPDTFKDLPSLLSVVGSTGTDGNPHGLLDNILGTTSQSGFLDEIIGHNVVNGGADEFGKFGLVSDSDASALVASLNLKSDGSAIDHAESIDIPILGTVMGFFAEDGHLVFTLTVGPLGDYDIRLVDQLDHPLTDNPDTPEHETAFQDTLTLDLGKFITYTDYDGDKIDLGGHVTLSVVDDIPVVTGSLNVTLDEDDLSDFDPVTAALLQVTPAVFEALPSILRVVGSDGTDQNPTGLLDNLLGTTSKSGLLNELIGNNVVTGGADEFGKFGVVSDADANALVGALNLSSDGSPINHVESVDLGTIAGIDIGTVMGFFSDDGRLIFTLTVGDLGNYDIRLVDQLDHPLTDNPDTDTVETAFQDTLHIDLGKFVTYTDFDGDKIDLGTGHLTLDVIDDVPETVDGAKVIATVEEEDGTVNIPLLSDMGHGNEDTDDDAGGLDTDTAGSSSAITNVATGSLGGLVKVGADDHGVFAFDPSVKDQVVQFDGHDMTSRGATVRYELLTLSILPGLPAIQMLVGYADTDNSGHYDNQISLNPDRLVFAVALSEVNPLDGLTNDQFVYVQLDQVDHAPPSPAGTSAENLGIIDLSQTVTFTDADGDKIGLNGGSFEIQVIDDVPVQVAGAQVTGTVEEEQLAGGNDDATPDPEDGDFTIGPVLVGSITTAVAKGSLASLFDVGADEVAQATVLGFPVPGTGVGTFSLATDTSGLPALTSNHENIAYVVVGNTLTAYVDSGNGGGLDGADRPVFTLEVDSNGDYTFTLIDQLDHADANTPHPESEDILQLDLSSVIRFSDRDGDTIGLDPQSHAFTIKVIDDMPDKADITINNTDPDGSGGLPKITLMIDETAGVQSATSAPDTDAPTDKTKEDDVGSLPAVFSGVAALTGLTGYAYAERAGAVSITPDYGADQPGTLAVALTRSTGAAFSGQDSGLVDAQSDDKIFLYTDPVSGIVLGRIGTSGGAADPNGTIAFAVGSTLSGTSVTLSMVEYRGVEHPDHNDRDESLASSFNKIYVTATQTDADGDQLSTTSSSPLLINIDDDGPSIVSDVTAVTATVEEDGMTLPSSAGEGTNVYPDTQDGNKQAGDDSTQDQASGLQGSLSPLVNFGADGPAAGGGFSVSTSTAVLGQLPTLYSDGHPVTYSSDGTTITATNSLSQVVFTMTVNANGSWSFDLDGQLDHVAGGGENTALRTNAAGTTFVSSIDFSPVIIATDGDGDSITGLAAGKVAITVEDDIPTIAAPVSGAGPDLINNGSFEDPASVPGGWYITTAIPGWHDGSDGVPFEIQQGGAGGVSAQDGNNLVELDSDTEGNNQGDSNPTDHTNATIAQDVATVVGQTYELTFYYAPRPGHELDNGLVASVNGTPVHTVADNDPKAAGWTEVTVSFVASSTTSTIAFTATGGEDEFGLLLDNVSMHALSAYSIDEDALNTIYSVGNNDTTSPGDDAGGASVNGSLGIVWGADAVDQSDGGLGHSANGGYLEDSPDNVGDRSVVFSSMSAGVSGVNGALMSHGDIISYSWNGDHTILSGVAGSGNSARTVFEVSLSDDDSGHFNFVLLDQLDHAPGQNENNIFLTFGYTATDSDGDSVDGNFVINVDDDMPIFGRSDSATVDEDDLLAPGPFGNTPTGNADNAPGDDNGGASAATSVIGSFGINFGADGPAATGAISAVTIQSGLSSDGVPIATTLTYDSGTDAWYGMAGSEKVFSLAFNIATGQYTFTLLDNLDHPETGTEDNITLNFGFTAKDFDGDTALGSISVDVDDDMPVAPLPAQNLVADGNFAGGSGDFPNSQNAWQPGSGSDPDGLANWQLTGPAIEKVGDGYLGMHTSTGGTMVDMAASPGNIQLTQTIPLTGVSAYEIQFEAGAPFPSTAELQVIWNGNVVATIDPAGPMTSYSLSVTSISGNNTLSFKEVGTEVGGSNGVHGTYLANVAMYAVNASVDEDGLTLANSVGNAVGVGDSTQVGDAPTNAADTGDVALGIKWGADDNDTTDSGTQDNPLAVATRSLTFTDDTVVVAGGTPLHSNGELVSYALTDNGTRLVGYVDHGAAGYDSGSDRLVFEVSLSDDNTGSFNFKLHDKLDHALNGNENDVALTFGYTAKDSDGDTSSGQFIVTVDDDVPVIGKIVGPDWYDQTFDDVTDGSHSGFESGDGYGAVTVYSSGVTPTGWSSAVATQSGSGKFAVVTQSGPVGDESGPYTRFDDYKADFEGGFKSSIAIYLDPMQIGAGNGFDYSVSVGDQNGGFRRDFIFHVGETTGGTLYVSADNNSGFAPLSDSQWASIANKLAVPAADAGWYTFTQTFHDAGDGTLAVDLQVWDSTGTLLFTETRHDASDTLASAVGGSHYGWFPNIDVPNGIAVDDVSLSPLGDVGFVNEDDLAGGNDGTPPVDPTAITGHLSINWGADNGDARTVVFTAGSAPAGLMSHGVGVSYWVSADGTELVAYRGSGATSLPALSDQVFTVTLNDSGDGSYTFSLLDSIDHAPGEGQNITNLGFAFDAIDSDGDRASSIFHVAVQDDVPIAVADDPVTIDEDSGLYSGNVLDNDHPGADGATLEKISFDGHSFVAITGSPFHQPEGNYTFSPNGDWTFTPAANYNGSTGFSYIIIDGDGDESDPPVGFNVNIHVNAVNDPPAIDVDQSLATGSVVEAGDISGLDEAGPSGTVKLSADLNAQIALHPAVGAAIADVVSNPSHVATALTTIASELGGGEAQAIGILWNALDDLYTPSYPAPDAINEAFARLGIAYVQYLQAGNPPLVDVTAKYTNDLDHDATPDRDQSLHDNLLGNITSAALLQHFAGNPSLITSLSNEISALDPDLLTRVYASGNQHSTSVADGHAFDLTHGLVTTASGTLTFDDPDIGDTHAWSIDSPLQGTYGSIAIDAASGEWVYTLDNTLAATQALGVGETGHETFTARVTDGDSASDTISLMINVTGSNDAPVISLGSGETTSTSIIGFNGETLVTRALTEDTPLHTSGQLTVGDVDTHDTVTATVLSVSGGGGGYTPGAAALGFLTLSANPVLADPHSGTNTLTWTFDAGSEHFDFLPQGFQTRLNYTVQVSDGHGGVDTQVISVVVTGVNDAPIVSGEVSKDIQEAGDLAKVDEAGLGGGVLLRPTLTVGEIGAVQGFVSNPSTFTEAGVQAFAATYGYDEQTAIAVIWTALDGHYTSGGPNDINIAFTKLGMVYAQYLQGGGTPLVDVLAKVTDNALLHQLDASTDRIQTMHDNLLGNLTDYSLAQHYNYALGLTPPEVFPQSDLHDAIAAIDSGLLSRPYVGGYPTDVDVNLARSFDQTDGFAHHITGQLTATDAEGDTVNWSVVNGNGTYGTLGIDATGKWTYTLDDLREATEKLAEGEHHTETFTVKANDGHGGITDVPVSIEVYGTNDAPVIVSSVATPFVGGGLDDVREADVGPQYSFEPNTNVDGTIASQLAAHPDDMALVLQNVQAALGGSAGLADAIAAVWDYVDDNYSYYDTAINEAGARLGIEYAKYLLAGNAPLTEVVAKYTPDGGDGDLLPDREQTLHDNLLGNLSGPSLVDKLLGAGLGSNPTPDPAGYQAIIDLVHANGLDDYLTRPIYGGYETDDDAPTRTWDQVHGLIPLAMGQVTATDVDNGAVLTYSAVSSGADPYGTFTLDASTGAWQYVVSDNAATRGLAAGQHVTETYTVTVSDEHGATDSIAIPVTITGVNDAPIAHADTFVEVPDGWTLATDDSGHVYKFVTLANSTGWADARDAVASMLDGNAYLATITSQTENDIVLAVVTSAGGPNVIAYLGGSDAANEGVWQWVTGPEAGQTFFVGDNTNGSTVPPFFANWDSSDGGEPNDNGTGEDILWLYGNFRNGTWNDAPLAGGLPFGGYIFGAVAEAGEPGSFYAAIDEDHIADINAALLLQNDDDADGDVLTVTGVSATSANGAAVDLSGGIIHYDPTAAAAIQHLGAGQTLIDSFTYAVSDGHGGTSSATVSLTVQGVNDAPIANDDTASVNEDQTVTINALANDTDADGDALSITHVDGQAISLGSPVTLASGGVVSLNADGTLSYDPNGHVDPPGTTSITDSFNYTVSDGHGGSDVGAVDVTVNGVAFPPPAPAGQVWVYDSTHTLVAVYGAAGGSAPDGVTYFVSTTPINAAVDSLTGPGYSVVVGSGYFHTGGHPIDIDQDNTRVYGNEWGVDPREAAGLRTLNGADESIVDGDHGTQVFRIRGDNIEINGFNLRNTSADLVTTDGVTGDGGDSGAVLSYNIASQSGDDGLVLYKHTGGVIDHNLIFATNDGINVVGNNGSTTDPLAAFNNVVSNNEVDGGWDNGGIYVYGASNTTITGNYVHDYAGDSGIVLGTRRGYGNPNPDGGTISNNVVENSGENGIDVFQSDVVVSGNTITGNKGWAVAVGIDYNGESHATPKPDNVLIEDNTFADNNHGKPSGTAAGDTPADGPVLVVPGATNVGYDHNTIDGTAIGNVLYGTAGGDVIVGGDGTDTLSGGGGSDTFQWGAETLGPGSSDTITDYSFTDGDKIDLQALVAGFGSGTTVVDYVKVGVDGSGHDLLVSVDATGTGTNYQLAYTLVGAVDAGIDTVRFHVGGGDYTVDTAGVYASVVDPLVLDLDGDGVHFNAAASFDLDHDGRADRLAWPGPHDGILVADLDHSGSIENGNEVFSPAFGEGGHANSLDALRAYDSNGDGKITADDAQFGDIGVWTDSNGNGVSDQGELHSLSDLGVVSIDLGAEEVDFDLDGQHVFAQGTFELSNGETHDFVGVDLGMTLPDLTGGSGASADVSYPEANVQTGTDGADNFVVGNLNAVDFIADYNFGQGDTVDISALLGENSGATKDNATDYVRVENGTVQVDSDGAGTAHDFVDVAVLNQPVAEVKIILDDGVDVTINHLG